MNQSQNDRRGRNNQRRGGAPLYNPIGVDIAIENKVRGLQRIVRMDAMNRYLNNDSQDELSQRLRLDSGQLFAIFTSLYQEIVALWPTRPSPDEIRAQQSAQRGTSTPVTPPVAPEAPRDNPNPESASPEATHQDEQDTEEDPFR